jgi:hypothetical protein
VVWNTKSAIFYQTIYEIIEFLVLSNRNQKKVL